MPEKRKADCRDITDLVKNINQEPDIMHQDYSAAVHELLECGLPAAEAVLPLLDSQDRWERYRAQRVLEGVVKRWFGWRPNQGFPEGQATGEDVLNLFRANGNYQADAPRPDRLLAMQRWATWLRQTMRDEEDRN